MVPTLPLGALSPAENLQRYHEVFLNFFRNTAVLNIYQTPYQQVAHSYNILFNDVICLTKQLHIYLTVAMINSTTVNVTRTETGGFESDSKVSKVVQCPTGTPVPFANNCNYSIKRVAWLV